MREEQERHCDAAWEGGATLSRLNLDLPLRCEARPVQIAKLVREGKSLGGAGKPHPAVPAFLESTVWRADAAEQPRCGAPCCCGPPTSCACAVRCWPPPPGRSEGARGAGARGAGVCAPGHLVSLGPGRGHRGVASGLEGPCQARASKWFSVSSTGQRAVLFLVQVASSLLSTFYSLIKCPFLSNTRDFKKRKCFPFPTLTMASESALEPVEVVQVQPRRTQGTA